MKRQSCKYERFATQKGSGIKKISFVLTFGFHGSQWQGLMLSQGRDDGELKKVVDAIVSSCRSCQRLAESTGAPHAAPSTLTCP
jgi:hypothetical protein